MVRTPGERLFLDTNILLAATDRAREQHETITGLIKGCLAKGLQLCLSGQVLREYLVVAIRPVASRGLGLNEADARSNITEFRRCTAYYEETEAVFDRLFSFVRDYQLHGKRIHDANIVATISAHNLTTLVTDNPDDFSNFREIAVLTSAQAEAGL